MRFKSYLMILQIFVLFYSLFFANITILARTKTMEVPVMEDLYVESGYPDTPTYNQRNLYVGWDTWFGKAETRIYIYPDFEFLNNRGITEEKIKKVRLKLYLYEYEGDSPTIDLKIYRALQFMSPYDVIWNNQPDLRYYYYCSFSSQEGEKLCSITSLFKDYYSVWLASRTTLPIVLLPKLETQKAAIFFSKECVVHAGLCAGGQTPRVVVEYEDNTMPTKPMIISPQNNTKFAEKSLVIKWTPSEDEDGDRLSYKVEVSRDERFEHIYRESTWIENTEYGLTLAKDGPYFLRVRVKDEYGNYNQSEVVRFMVDTTPPAVPEFVSVPPFISTLKYRFEWYLSVPEEKVTYEFQWGAFKDFRDSQSSGWISENSYSVSFPEEGEYYLRVRAKDDLGNISVWSKVYKIVVDKTTPVLDLFTVSPEFFNASSRKSIYIKFRVKDLSLDRIGIRVYDSNGKVLYEKLISGSDHLYERWYYPSNLKEGIYFIYGVAQDHLGHVLHTNPIAVVNDKTKPILEFTPCYNGEYVRQKCIAFRTLCRDISPVQLTWYVNNRRFAIVRKNTSQRRFCLKEGKNTIRVRCADSVGFSVSKAATLIVDSTPPKPPRLHVERVSSSLAKLKVVCEPGTKLKLFLYGRPIKERVCKSGRWSYTFTAVWGNLYVFSAKSKDKAGNESKISRVTYKHTFLSSTKSKGNGKAVRGLKSGGCIVEYNTQTHKIISYHCNLGIGKRYTISTQKKKYALLGRVKTTWPTNLKVKLRIYSCKPFSFWDMRTWFGCVPQYKHTKKIRAYAFYSLRVDRVLAFGVPLKQGLYFKFNNLVPNPLGTVTVRILLFNIRKILKLEKRIELGYKGVQGASAVRPLGWIFRDLNVLVSQWHGYTAYQHPHTGIDFAVYKKEVVAPADGIVVAVGYHMPTKCFGGGYYLGIKHSSNLYTFYFHLNRRPRLKRGQRVKKGQVIAITGNSGRYHCHNLAYHLHFEVRRCISPKCHVNPVPYMDVDWRRIKTAVYGKYWGRLSGENPHPSY